MSVIASYARLDETGLECCRANPSWLEALYDGSIAGAEVVDIDKACDGLVWLLARVPSAPTAIIEGAAFVLQATLAPLLRGEGGKQERRLEAPYGPASLLSPGQVCELSTWLAAIDPAVLRARYDPHAMHADNVYPHVWAREEIVAFDQYLLPAFRRLQAFFARAAEAGQLALVFFT